MATNSGRGNPGSLQSSAYNNADTNHNIIVAASEGIQDATSTPPAVPAAEKKEIVESATGAHATGQDAGAAAAAAAGVPKVKTEKECT